MTPGVPEAGSSIGPHPIPRATYRLQLTADFNFGQAAAQAPYLARLGISHAYLSPVLRARRGSKHGYDTVDHTILNPELGSRRDFEAMVAAFRAHGMGIILDIVPNHMGIGGDENGLWLDVLRWGPKSRYADWFDINWSPPEPTLKNKVLVPMLGTSFGEALERGALELRHDADTGDYAVWAEGAHKLPVYPDTYHMIGGASAVERLNSTEGRPDLIRLIEAQNWRVARYSVSADDINYRRFFIVSDLAAVRVERDDVFDQGHRLTFELVEAGLVDGLRVDHIDGLYDPKAYCLKLRERCPRPIYLVVEKILAPHEALRSDWQVDGTTGYEFSSIVTRLLTDPKGEEALTRAYTDFVGETETLADEERVAKRSIIDFEMAAELDALTARLRTIAASAQHTADLTRNGLRSALREVVAAMPVYRTYVDGDGLAAQDRRNIAVAVGRARKATPELDPAFFEFLEAVLTGDLCRDHNAYDPTDVLDIARRIQQYTGPVMAKGLEDTALYRYNRLIALSDVGEKPDRFTASVAAFHDFNIARVRAMPNGMLTTSSHDTKRGEDARARIAALSGSAEEWASQVSDWSALLATAGAPPLTPNDRYYFFQLLLGAWPTTLTIDAPHQVDAFAERIKAAMLKSVREARANTNWNVPKTGYEADVERFVESALRPGPFLVSFLEFERRVALAGARNGLIETVLKLTIPGVPDIYQGAEFWEQSMVDPDNRRPVDFDLRAAGLGDETPIDLLADWRDGRIKQKLIADLLACRAHDSALFAEGSYEPIDTPDGSICAFVRRFERRALVVAIALYPGRVQPRRDGRLTLPHGLSWDDLHAAVGERSADGSLASMFPTLPLMVLTTKP
jgi:(1->4)-alpha-D-glucan 1-alpha-D-glucosylmutase